MPVDTKRGDHDYVDAHDPEQFRAGYLPISVWNAEDAAIKKRRECIKNKGIRDRTVCPLTGLALSGGGIRSASFGLGALQALHVSSGIEGIDYLSTVSGGGYIGCSLTAAMQESAVGQNTPGTEKTAETRKTNGKFPFTNLENYDDTDSVRHIRDYSNYLIPHGALDVVTALGIIGRGLVANVLIILPVLLFFVWFTLLIYPTEEWLGKPRFLFWDCRGLIDRLGLHDLPGYWFTVILAGVNIVFLIVWAFAKSASVTNFWQSNFAWKWWPGHSAELRGGLVTISIWLFFITVIMAWLETQPFILYVIGPRSTPQAAAFASSAPGQILQGWFEVLTPIFAPIGAIFAVFSKQLSDIVARAARDSRWQAWLKKILAMAALWLAAIFIPSLVWVVYLWLTHLGISQPVPDWLSSFAYATPQAMCAFIAAAVDCGALRNFVQRLVPTAAALLYLEAFLITLLVASFINPNVTSLYRLYRDRLSKAFLFDPDGRRDKHGDLPAYEPKLHQIDTNLCPYPIVNASLNIERSQYANKRGRNADFFAFTPEYTGSDATGYIGTRRIEEDETALDLGTALAISGAAVSSNMGALTIKPLTFTLALLNVRLGYWLRNPRRIVGHRPWYSRLFDIRSFLLFKEALSWITEKSPTVYLTDGGHVENLGVYSLLKRRCKVIIAIDAEADPIMSFHALLKLERFARIDLGVIIDLPWEAIRDQTLELGEAFDNATSKDSTIPCLPGPHCAVGEIQYGPNETGTLVYVKASLTGDEPDYLLDYKRRNRAFPHETTGDQFFSEEQLEAYRALGFHIMKGLLTGEAPVTVKSDPKEPEDKKRQRILDEVHAALLGTAAKSGKRS